MASKHTRLDKKQLIVLGALLGVETVLCAAIVMGMHTRETGMVQTLRGKETALQNVRTVSAGLPGLEAEYSRMQAQVRFLERALPPAEYIPTLLGQVEQVAKSAGVKIQEVRPKQAPPPPPGQEAASATGTTQQVFDMTVSGSYPQVQRFLQALTRFRKILALNSIKLSPSQGVPVVGVSPKLVGNLTITAYVMAPAGPVQAPAGAKPAAAPAPASGQQVANGQGVTAPVPAPRG